MRVLFLTFVALAAARRPVAEANDPELNMLTWDVVEWYCKKMNQHAKGGDEHCENHKFGQALARSGVRGQAKENFLYRWRRTFPQTAKSIRGRRLEMVKIYTAYCTLGKEDQPNPEVCTNLNLMTRMEGYVNDQLEADKEEKEKSEFLKDGTKTEKDWHEHKKKLAKAKKSEAKAAAPA